MTASFHDKALSYISSIRFHRSFILPPNPQHGRPSSIRVTYSDCDYRTSPDGPVILLIGGMMGGRYMSAGVSDAMARYYKLRLLCVDKCGMGGTADMDLKWRMQTWLDILPRLLASLSIPHVAIVCHSVGAVYALNTILTHRHILHPLHPYLVFLAPWSHPSHSSTLKPLTYIPSSLISAWPSVQKAIVMTSIAPPVTFSTGLVKTAFSFGRSKKVSNERPEDVDEDTWAMKPFLWDLILPCMFEENVQGSAHEAQLCLKKGFGEEQPWGLFEDYDQAVKMVVEQEALLQRQRQLQNSEGDAAPRQKLTVHAFYAEKDGLVGKGGGVWMDKCWRETEGVAERIEFVSETVPDADHDGIADVQKGIVSRIMKHVVESFKV